MFQFIHRNSVFLNVGLLFIHIHLFAFMLLNVYIEILLQFFFFFFSFNTILVQTTNSINRWCVEFDSFHFLCVCVCVSVMFLNSLNLFFYYLYLINSFFLFLVKHFIRISNEYIFGYCQQSTWNVCSVFCCCCFGDTPSHEWMAAVRVNHLNVLNCQ